jgi:hypothetical protein
MDLRQTFPHGMKTTRTLAIVLLLAFVAVLAYGLGYQHGRTSASSPIVALNSVRQVGLSFRTDRNDIGQFSATSPIISTKETQ